MLTGTERQQIERIKKEVANMLNRITREKLSGEGEEVQLEKSDTVDQLNALIDSLDALHKPSVLDSIVDMSLRVAPDVHILSAMTESELKELRGEWYQKGRDSNIISSCYLIANELGNSCGDSKVMWLHGNIKEDKNRFRNTLADLVIYNDRYGNYMTVHYLGKQVVSTHKTDKLFVPGDWVKIVDQFQPIAQATRDKKEAEYEESNRQKLLGELLG